MFNSPKRPFPQNHIPSPRGHSAMCHPTGEQHQRLPRLLSFVPYWNESYHGVCGQAIPGSRCRLLGFPPFAREAIHRYGAPGRSYTAPLHALLVSSRTLIGQGFFNDLDRDKETKEDAYDLEKC